VRWKEVERFWMKGEDRGRRRWPPGDLRSMRGRDKNDLHGSGPRSVFNTLKKKRNKVLQRLGRCFTGKADP
jgi:hypothetical protein